MKKEEFITVLKIEVGKEAYVKQIKNDLASMQKEVDGLIEIVSIDNNTVLVCNEEGKVYNFKGNRVFGNDIICGDFFVAGDDYKTGELMSLTDEQIEKTKEMFKNILKFKEDDPRLEPVMKFFKL